MQNFVSEFAYILGCAAGVFLVSFAIHFAVMWIIQSVGMIISDQET